MDEKSVRNRILSLSRGAKQALMLGADTFGLVASVLLGTWLLSPAVIDLSALAILIAATFIVSVLSARQEGFYHSIVRYVGMDLAVSGVKVAFLSAVAIGVAAQFLSIGIQPVKLAVGFAGFFLLYLLGSRYAAQYLLNRRNPERECVIIYGAGEAGARLVLSLQDGDSFLPVAVVDDKTMLQGNRVGGILVHPRQRLEDLISEFDVTRVLLALPSASRRRRLTIISNLEKFNVHIQTIPDLNHLVSGKARVDDLRDVDVADLLGRDAVPPDNELLRASVTGKSVMVTGAGGSIGSELCRHVLRQSPRTLVLFEISEVALYSIEKEIRKLAKKHGIDTEIVGLLGSVHHQDRVHEVMQSFEVKTVYHAAAYKHVPVVEQNILEGVHNNIFGTLHLARAAVQARVETFVLISTDKAVSPTNVMGATKRFSELVLQAMQDQHEDCCFCMVRFGNVLESSGSVVPLFREQIRAGGPVTVTHRDIIRYFMTIPEAAQLVIQAGAMARGGDVFVLDMGDPVKIQDLARRMIRLMGLTVRDDENPDGDIEIEYTGLRPAEKLYEELMIGTNVSGTSHPRIMRANEEYIESAALLPLIEQLMQCSRSLDRDCVRQVLLDSVSGYKPTNGIDDLVWVKNRAIRQLEDSEKVVSLPKRSA